MAPHSSTLAWKIPWTEEPGRLQSMGSHLLDMTERLPFHFSLSCIGEGNGNPLQCSCLENPRDGGAWWAAIYGVAQSRTRLKRLSSPSSSSSPWLKLTDAFLTQILFYGFPLVGWQTSSSKLMVKVLLSGAELGSDSVPFRREGMPVEGGDIKKTWAFGEFLFFIPLGSSLQHTGSSLWCTGLSSCGTRHV